MNQITCTIKQATAMSGLGKTILYEALADGRLSGIHVGRRRLIHVASLRSFLGVDQLVGDGLPTDTKGNQPWTRADEERVIAAKTSELRAIGAEMGRDYFAVYRKRERLLKCS